MKLRKIIFYLKMRSKIYGLAFMFQSAIVALFQAIIIIGIGASVFLGIWILGTALLASFIFRWAEEK